MADANFADKTIWTGDNLDILRGMNSECVDLIYLDPPFNSNQNYAAPVGSAAAGAAFKDTWTLSDLDVAWMGLIADEQPATAHVLKTAGLTHGKGMQSYLTMMAVRLMEMQTGPEAYGQHLPALRPHGQPLPQAVDGWDRLGPGNFRNEVRLETHCGPLGRQATPDLAVSTMFCCSTLDREPLGTGSIQNMTLTTWQGISQRGPKGPLEVSQIMTASGQRSGESGEPWRGVDPGKVGRHWSTPTQGGMNDFIISKGLDTWLAR